MGRGDSVLLCVLIWQSWKGHNYRLMVSFVILVLIAEPFHSCSFWFWKTLRELTGEDLLSVSNLPFFTTTHFVVLMFGFELSFGHLVIEFLKGRSILTSCRVYIMKFCHPIVNSRREMGKCSFWYRTEIVPCKIFVIWFRFLSYLPTDFWPEVWVRNCLKH